jgi:hypothetical protein
MRVTGPLNDLIVILAAVQALGVGYLSIRATRRLWVGVLAGVLAGVTTYAMAVLTFGEPID